jgi:chromosome partitioning protein
MRVVAIVNFKGGTGKTTTAAWVTHALAEAGLNVFLADADPQLSITTWAAAADWPVPAAGLAVPNLHTRLAGVAGGRDVVIIDTPPLEDHRAIVTSALRIATHVLVPMAPTPIEYVQLAKVRDAIEDVAPLRHTPTVDAVLFTRVRAGTASYPAHRDQVAEDGWRVLTPYVGQLERFAQSFGSPITGAMDTGYGDAIAELLTLEPAA